MAENDEFKFRGRKLKYKKNGSSKKNKRDTWVIRVSILGFLISATISVISSRLLSNVHLAVAFLILFIIIVIGIFFDMVGLAVAAADETPFHAMASRKMPGAKQAIFLIRNANKVSSICNDVVGDICGVLSGSMGALIVVAMSRETTWGLTPYFGFLVTGFIASATIGGKAIGKTLALKKSNTLVYRVSIILSFFIGRINSETSRKK
ncbi:MAG TPA: Mg2+ and Co2+ transporter CorB [Clostridiaceae bacterium]|nr:Mg2+ and Co2+ transporter CorB [Clostridiaceae bacterium]